MTFTLDVAMSVNLVVRCVDDLRRKGQYVCPGQDHAVEFDAHPPLTPEVAGRSIVLQMSAELSPARKNRMPERAEWTKITQDGIAHLRSFRGEIRFIHGPVQERSGWNQMPGFS